MTNKTGHEDVNVALFCGGRGSNGLVGYLSQLPFVKLTLLVNGYDDGLSTGKLRALLPGYLGPSDFRKNLSSLLSFGPPYSQALGAAMEHRIWIDCSHKPLLDSTMNLQLLLELDPELAMLIDKLSPEIVGIVMSRVETLFELLAIGNRTIDFRDVSFGNLIMAGSYVFADFDFDKALQEIVDLADVRPSILNVSEDSCFLGAKLSNGGILRNENEIVSSEEYARIEDLIFFKNPGGAAAKHNDDANELAPTPRPSAKVIKALSEADLVVLGAGTQHSSLFPSYKIISQEVRLGSLNCKVVLVSNLDEDKDIRGWSHSNILEKAEMYLDSPGCVSKIIVDRLSSIPLGIDLSSHRSSDLFMCEGTRDENAAEKHSGARLAKELLSLLNSEPN